MPNARQTARQEAVAEALAEGRSAVATEVVAAAHRREDTGYAPVALRQNLDPRAGASGRAAGILAAVAEAGLLDPGFAPRIPRNLTTGEPEVVLTRGQIDVLRCAAQGLSYTETADALHLSVSTVKGHVGAYYRTLGVHAVPEAVIAGIRVGVLPVSVVTGQTPTVAEAAPAEDTPRTRAQCAAEGCRKRTTHPSGLCPDHRAED